MLIQAKLLQENLEEERDFVELSGLLLSDQSSQLLIGGGWSGILLLSQGMHSFVAWILEID